MRLNVSNPRSVWVVCATVLAVFFAVVTIVPIYAFEIGFLLAFGAWVFTIMVVLREQRVLYAYLKRHHHTQWAEITSGPFWGAGGRNSARGLRFIFNRTGPQDARLEDMKARLRGAIFCIPVVVALLILLVIVGGVVGQAAARGL